MIPGRKRGDVEVVNPRHASGREESEVVVRTVWQVADGGRQVDE